MTNIVPLEGMLPARFARQLGLSQMQDPAAMIRNRQLVSVPWHEVAARRLMAMAEGPMEIPDGHNFAEPMARAFLNKGQRVALELRDYDLLLQRLVLDPPQTRLSIIRRIIGTNTRSTSLVETAAVKAGRRQVILRQICQLKALAGLAFECSGVAEVKNVDDLLPGDMLIPLAGVDFAGRPLMLIEKQLRVLNIDRMLCCAKEIALDNVDGQARAEKLWDYLRHNLRQFGEKDAFRQYPGRYSLAAVIIKLALQEAGLPGRIVQGERRPAQDDLAELDQHRRKNERPWVEIILEDTTLVIDVETLAMFPRPAVEKILPDLSTKRVRDGFRVKDKIYVYAPVKNRVYRPLSYLGLEAKETVAAIFPHESSHAEMCLEGTARQALFGITDIGDARRSINESNGVMIGDGYRLCFAVFDGIGGAAESEYASLEAAEATIRAHTEGADMNQALQNAAFRVWLQNEANASNWAHFAATTAMLGWFSQGEQQLHLIEIGDLKGFRIREGRLYLLNLADNRGRANITGMDRRSAIPLPLELGWPNVFIGNGTPGFTAVDYYDHVRALTGKDAIVTACLIREPMSMEGRELVIPVNEGDAFLFADDGLDIFSVQEILDAYERTKQDGAEAFARELFRRGQGRWKDNVTMLALFPQFLK
ncbi:MAG: protein phosphatase 2C domain-containing protein [Candidatus Margulisiibacteriota bacterium]